jgi:hypothetical protein
MDKEQLIQIKEIVLVCEDVFDRVITLGVAFVFEDFLFWDHDGGKKFKARHSLAAKIEFLDIIGRLVQENIYFSKRTILDCSPFEHILELLDVYPSSSMFHNCIMKTITPFFVTDVDSITLNKVSIHPRSSSANSSCSTSSTRPSRKTTRSATRRKSPPANATSHKLSPSVC